MEKSVLEARWEAEREQKGSGCLLHVILMLLAAIFFAALLRDGVF